MAGPNAEYEGFIVAALPFEGRTHGKFYATDIRRREPDFSREWAHQTLDWRDVKQGLEELFEKRESGLLVPRVVISFPHVSRIYWPGDPDDETKRETNWYGSLFDTHRLENINASSIGCDAEIAILGQEREFWRSTWSVEAYLERFVPEGSLGRVEDTNKLWRWKRHLEQ